MPSEPVSKYAGWPRQSGAEGCNRGIRLLYSHLEPYLTPRRFAYIVRNAPLKSDSIFDFVHTSLESESAQDLRAPRLTLIRLSFGVGRRLSKRTLTDSPTRPHAIVGTIASIGANTWAVPFCGRRAMVFIPRRTHELSLETLQKEEGA